jgi:hypothetical protein
VESGCTDGGSGGYQLELPHGLFFSHTDNIALYDTILAARSWRLPSQLDAGGAGYTPCDTLRW